MGARRRLNRGARFAQYGSAAGNVCRQQKGKMIATLQKGKARGGRICANLWGAEGRQIEEGVSMSMRYSEAYSHAVNMMHISTVLALLGLVCLAIPARAA